MSIPYLVVMVTQIKVTDSGGYLKKWQPNSLVPKSLLTFTPNITGTSGLLSQKH